MNCCVFPLDLSGFFSIAYAAMNTQLRCSAKLAFFSIAYAAMNRLGG